MAIYIAEGKPGAGKTYYMIYHLLQKYFFFDKILKEYMPKLEITIITNIEEIKLNAFNLEEMVKVAGGVEKFFTRDYQKTLLKRFSRIVYIIDEAGNYFGKDFKNDNVLFLFQYHRHLGLDFYLIVPSVYNLTRQLVDLAEYQIHARPRSSRLIGAFAYDKIFGGEKAGAISIPAKQEVFRLYKSMTTAEGEKIRSFTRRYLVLAILGVAFSVGAFLAVTGHMAKGSIQKKNERTAQKQKNKEVGKKQLTTKEQTAKNIKTEEAKGYEDKEFDKRDRAFIPDVLSEDRYVRIDIIETIDGRKIIYAQDGRYWKDTAADAILKVGVVLGGEVYIPRDLSKSYGNVVVKGAEKGKK